MPLDLWENLIAFDEAVFARLLPDMVPKAGLEPARLSPLPPQDSVSTNSTTWAFLKKFTLVTYFRDTWAPARRLPIPHLSFI